MNICISWLFVTMYKGSSMAAGLCGRIDYSWAQLDVWKFFNLSPSYSQFSRVCVFTLVLLVPMFPALQYLKHVRQCGYEWIHQSLCKYCCEPGLSPKTIAGLAPVYSLSRMGQPFSSGPALISAQGTLPTGAQSVRTAPFVTALVRKVKDCTELWSMLLFIKIVSSSLERETLGKALLPCYAMFLWI